jgi:hypothetical protein
LNNDVISMQKLIGTLCIVFTNLYILYFIHWYFCRYS